MIEWVAAILIADGRVLMGLRHRSRRLYPGCWDLPGGHVEPGETGAVALARELAEELGIAATPEAPWRSIVDANSGFRLRIWRLRTWYGEPRNLAPEEHERIGWFTPDACRSLPLADRRYLSILAEAVAAD